MYEQKLIAVLMQHVYNYNSNIIELKQEKIIKQKKDPKFFFSIKLQTNKKKLIVLIMIK